MEDRRKQIIDAGLALLREEGLPGLTQPRIAARTGLRQSHLTYYYPTRTDLVEAVARAAIDNQAADTKAMMKRITSSKEAANVIAAGTAKYENTRVLIALSQSAQNEPRVRALFNEFNDAMRDELRILLTALGLDSSQAHTDIVQATFIGLSIINLATNLPDGQARSKPALDTIFAFFAGHRPEKS